MRAYLLAAALTVIAGPTLAQQPPLDPKNAGEQVQRYLRALTACDVETVHDIIDPAISAFGVRGQFSQSKPVYVGALQISCRAGTKMNLQPKVLRHDEFGDIALTAIEVTGTTDTVGKITQADLRLTLVLKRDRADRVWRIIHSQTATAY